MIKELKQTTIPTAEEKYLTEGEVRAVVSESLNNLTGNVRLLSGQITNKDNTIAITPSGTTLESLSAGSLIDIQGWQQDMTYSATDLDTVAWTSGTITLGDGTTFAIDAGNTGDMAARTYIYFDKGTSETVLQITTTAGTAVGANKIMLATAINSAIDANFFEFGGSAQNILAAGNLEQETITANEIATDAIIEGKIAADAVVAAKIAVSGLDGTSGDVASNHIVAGMVQTNAITSVKINADAVTAAKINVVGLDGTSGRIVLADAIDANVVSSGINSYATTLIQAGKIVISGATNLDDWRNATDTTKIEGGSIYTNTVTATQIAAGTITATQIATDTITANEIAANTIDTGQIKAGAVTTTELAANTIEAGDIKAGTITTTEMTVATLSAISANLGTITAGTVTGLTLRSASSGAKWLVNVNEMTYYDGTNYPFGVVFTDTSGIGDAGDVSIGLSYLGGANKGLFWDASASTLTIRGTLNADDITTGTIDASTINMKGFYNWYVGASKKGEMGIDTDNNIKIKSDGNDIELKVPTGRSIGMFVAGTREMLCNGDGDWIPRSNEVNQLGTSATSWKRADIKDTYTSVHAYSSEKVKENIKTLTTPLEIINKLRGISFNYKKSFDKDKKPSFGLVAEEVEKILPELVSDDMGKGWDKKKAKIKTMEYIPLIGYLVEAIKEQDKKITNLENLVNAGKSN